MRNARELRRVGARIDERERTERNFAFNQASNETTRLVGSRVSEEKRGEV